MGEPKKNLSYYNSKTCSKFPFDIAKQAAAEK